MVIGRPKEFDVERALESAMHLFWRKGYESSSLQELLSTMGLSKSSFYQSFESKRALFRRCLEHYGQSLTDEMKVQLKNTESGKTFINGVFQKIAQETSGPDARRGCLLMNTASEFAQTDPEIAELVSNSIQGLTDVFEMAIHRTQEQGDISTDKDSRTLATYLLSNVSGLRNMVKAGADRETVKRVADMVLSAMD